MRSNLNFRLDFLDLAMFVADSDWCESGDREGCETWTQEFLPWILQVSGLPPSPLQVSTPCTFLHHQSYGDLNDWDSASFWQAQPTKLVLNRITRSGWRENVKMQNKLLMMIAPEIVFGTTHIKFKSFLTCLYAASTDEGFVQLEESSKSGFPQFFLITEEVFNITMKQICHTPKICTNQ